MVLPEHLNRNQVQTLTRSLKDVKFDFLRLSEEDLLLCFGSLSYNPSALKLQGLSWYPDILFHDFLVASTIHGFINYSNSSRAWSSKADRDHHAWLVVWSSTDFHQSTEYFQWSSRCFSFLFVGPVVDLGLDLFPWTQFLIVESWALTLTLASGGL